MDALNESTVAKTPFTSYSTIDVSKSPEKWLGKTEKVFQSESAGLMAERYACYASTTLGEHNAKTLSDQNHNSRRRPP